MSSNRSWKESLRVEYHWRSIFQAGEWHEVHGGICPDAKQRLPRVRAWRIGIGRIGPSKEFSFLTAKVFGERGYEKSFAFRRHRRFALACVLLYRFLNRPSGLVVMGEVAAGS